MSEQIFKNFLENTPPYKQEELTLDMIKYFKDKKLPKIECFCTECQKEKTFILTRLEDASNYPNWHNLNSWLTTLNPTGDCFKIDLTCIVEYRCTQCEKNYYYAFMFNDNKLMKIGQYPSFATLSHTDIEKYKNVISKYYIEFKQSLSAYSQGMGVASFVYLRRILEDLVEQEYNKLETNQDNIKFIDKLKAVEKEEVIIPEEITELKSQIYVILSKGVHEYTEEECLVMYEPVKFIIELILDRKLEEKERNKKIKSYSIAIKDKLKENK